MKLLRKLIIWSYWKLRCHQDEPWAEQLLLYAIPSSVPKDRYGLVALEIKQTLEKVSVEYVGWHAPCGIATIHQNSREYVRKL